MDSDLSNNPDLNEIKMALMKHSSSRIFSSILFKKNISRLPSSKTRTTKHSKAYHLSSVEQDLQSEAIGEAGIWKPRRSQT